MTDENAAELRRLAERATPGPWRQDENTSYVMTYRDVAPLTAAKGRDPSTAAFIAAANPAAVLDLLNERDALRAAATRVLAFLHDKESPFVAGDLGIEDPSGINEALDTLAAVVEGA